MKTVSPDRRLPRVVMFGMECEFTSTVAAELRGQGVTVSALLIPGHPSFDRPIRVGSVARSLPLAGTASADQTRPYPTYRVGSTAMRSVRELIDSFSPDAIVVACFPQLIPRHVYTSPNILALNIHPSLLPSHRGPDPLFWIMRAGGDGLGVTVHMLSQHLDTGPIVAQRAIPYPDGASERDLDKQLAIVGAELTANALLHQRVSTESAWPQDERGASYESSPTANDYAIDTNRPAREAWNFARGVAARGVAIRIDTASGPVYITEALELGDDGIAPACVEPPQVIINFASGWLRALSYRDYPD